MPLTIAHPAILLPLTKLPNRWFCWTGLVCGAIAPDFEYFFRLETTSLYTHNLDATFTINILIAFFIAVVYQALVKNTLINNAPSSIKLIYYKDYNLDWFKNLNKRYLIVLYSIIIGALSHLFWDSFTHRSGYFVEQIPTLSHSIFFGRIQLKPFKILQHTSTIVGTSSLFFYFSSGKQNLKETVKSILNSKKTKILFYKTSVITVIIWLLIIKQIQFSRIIVCFFSAAILSIILISIYEQSKKKNDSIQT